MSTDTFMELLQEEVSPGPDPRFAAEMDEWVAAGFPRRQPRRRAVWLDRAARAVRTPLGMAAASTAIAGIVIALLVVGDSTQQSTGGGGDVAATVPAESAGSDALVEPAPEQRSLAPSPPAAAGGVAPGQPNRKIERSSQMTLAAPADDFQSVGDRILRITDSHHGFVLRSNVSTGENPSGDFQLRVPGDELQATLRDLAANAQELARSRSQIKELRERTNFASVSVTLVEKKGASGGGAGAGSGTDD